MLEKFNEIDLTARNLVPREMGLWRDSLALVVVRNYAARPRPCHQRQQQSGASSVDRPFFGSSRRQLFMG